MIEYETHRAGNDGMRSNNSGEMHGREGSIRTIDWPLKACARGNPSRPMIRD